MYIFTHRGLEPSNLDFYPESSFEAFQSQIERGFGLEFDPNFCKDGIVVSHDATLKRITNGKDERSFSDVSLEEIKNIKYGNKKQGRIPTLHEVLELIRKSSAPIHAMHLKGKYQTLQNLNALTEHLEKFIDILNKIIVFDLKLDAARFLKSSFPQIHLAPSVAHEYDIERYNSVVGNTLFSIQEALQMKAEGVCDWVWLDEWDTANVNNSKKLFYTQETFKVLKDAGIKITLVTPELHGTSPGLYGGESHEHAANPSILFQRIKEIIALNPDAICTDWPEDVKEL